MSKIKIFNQETIKEILDMKKVIEVIEKVYKLKAKERCELFPMVFHEFERGVADMDIKSGHIIDEGIFGLKLVSWFGENTKKSMPALFGTTIIFDNETGQPLALYDAEYITGMRTGAAGAIGAKYLGRKDSKDMLMVGAGHQAMFQIAATLIAMDEIERVRVYDPMDYKNALGFVKGIKERLQKDFLSKYVDDKELYDEIAKKFDVEFIAVNDIAKATESSDIIITATPSRMPLIKKDWVQKGTHISTVGADMEGKQEIEGDIFAVAKVFVDDIDQAVNVGETELPIKHGKIVKEDIVGEIGQLLLGLVNGRSSDDDITIYDTTGIALQDLLTSKLVLDIANEKGLGTVVDL